MNRLHLTRREALLALAAAAAWPLVSRAAAVDLPADSVYQLPASLVDQDGRRMGLDAVRGTPVLASMFYASCDMVCPMIFETLHATLKALPGGERQATRVLLVSFDPERDTPAALKRLAHAHRCDERWTLATADAGTARELAAVLGIQYRRLDNGDFNHSSTIVLLDRDGRIAARSGTLAGADPALVKAAHRVHAARGAAGVQRAAAGLNR